MTSEKLIANLQSPKRRIFNLALLITSCSDARGKAIFRDDALKQKKSDSWEFFT